MSELAKQHCIAITKDTPRLNETEVKALLNELSGWQVLEKDGELRLEKAFKLKDFNEAISFTNQIARAANEEDHHPALQTEWGKVTVSWWTHRIHGLHKNDFIMAAKSEELYAEGISRRD